MVKPSSSTPSTLHKKRKAKTNPNKEENSNENSNGKGKKKILKEDLLHSNSNGENNSNKEEKSNENSNSKRKKIMNSNSKGKKHISNEDGEDEVQEINLVDYLMSKYCMENIFDNSDTEISDKDDEIGSFDYSFKLSDTKDTK